MHTLTKRLIGNFLVGFCTAFAAVSLVDGAGLNQKLLVGFIAGTTQGFLSVGKELLDQNPPKERNSKKSPLAALPSMMLVF